MACGERKNGWGAALYAKVDSLIRSDPLTAVDC
jgi:hypothetical protein